MAELKIDLLGTESAQSRLAERDRLLELDESTGALDTLGAAFQGNLGPQMWKTLSMKFQNTPEEDFDPADWLKTHGAMVPSNLHDRFADVRSNAEAMELADRINDDIHNSRILQSKGARGIAATMLVGLADIDAPLTLLTGGASKAATTTGRAAYGAVSGASVGTAFALGHVLVDPLAETSDIVNGALGGTALGGAGGLLLNRSVRSAREEFNEAAPGLANQNPHPPFVDSAGSLGAAFVGDTFDPSRLAAHHRGIFDESQQTLRQSGVAADLEDMEGASGHVAAMGRRLAQGIAKVPLLQSTFDEIAAGGTIMKAMAYDLLESPSGRVRNSTSASVLKENYENLLATELLPLDSAYQAWHKRQRNTILDGINGRSRAQFDREVLNEMDNRAHKGTLTKDKNIKQAADALDKHYALDVEIKKGRSGEQGISGSENLQASSGHYTREWSGNAMRTAMRRGVTKERIEKLIASAYATMHPNLKAKGHDLVVGKAIVRRALSHEDGIDSNMLITLNSDGQEFLRQTLHDSGYTDKEFKSLMNALAGKASERGQLDTTKSRIVLDMRTTDGDLSMMDLINTDLTSLTQRNTRKTAGAAALARKGILDKSQRKRMIEAAMAEMSERGSEDLKKARELMEDMFTHFDGGAIAGGASPGVNRFKRLANLGLLNQMGMTQLGEAGAQIAAVGMQTWMRHARTTFDEIHRGGPNGLAKELRHFYGELGNEHNLHRPELMLDDIENQTRTASEFDRWMGRLDYALGKGQRLQGYASGFYYVKSMQQKIAITSMADKVLQHLRDGTGTEQMRDIGIDPSRFKKYLPGVDFGDGFVNKLNMEQWSVDDAEVFALALRRYTNQVVQKTMAGEESFWWHKGVGPLFAHLKTFPLQAVTKQAARNMNMGTPVLTAQLTMGLATAGLAYTARQVINGREIEDPMQVAKGAIGMSNLTGWFPMFVDPVAAMLGMNDFRFNQFGRHSADTGIIGTPAALPTLNRMLHIPGALNPVGDMSTNDRIRAMQAAPLVGNAYGFTAIFNAMKN